MDELIYTKIVTKISLMEHAIENASTNIMADWFREDLDDWETLKAALENDELQFVLEEDNYGLLYEKWMEINGHAEDI